MPEAVEGRRSEVRACGGVARGGLDEAPPSVDWARAGDWLMSPSTSPSSGGGGAAIGLGALKLRAMYTNSRVCAPLGDERRQPREPKATVQPSMRGA
eukprot:566351-Prymnesium_polylepis.1